MLLEASGSLRIDVVFDVYREVSIKNVEGYNRCSTSGIQCKNMVEGHIVQQWRKVLNSADNKTQLICFLTNTSKQPTYRNKLQGKEMFVTCEEKCFRITTSGVTEVQSLESTQEEADTRLLLHAAHTSEAGYQSIIISSEDIDCY